eukprot:symbB.v1.2.026031.t2/scaffold2572.1/size76036/1
MVERVDGTHPTAMASKFSSETDIYLELNDIELFRSFWRRLPAHSAVALRAPIEAKEETLMLKVSKELMYRIHEFFWTEIDFDVAEMVCTACGCLAFRGAILRSKTSNDYARLRRWQRHWQRQGDFYHLGLQAQTDKVSEHAYEFIYHRTLPSLLNAGDCLLEIGFGCHMTYGPGASAQLWPKLYPEAKIHMVDINKHCVEKMGHEFLARQNYTVHIADQGKVADLERLKDNVLENCSQLSVIIDDGSHRSSDIIASFHSLYPLLKPGGRYFIEDIGWSSYHVLQGRMSFKYKDLYDTVPEDGLEYPGISIHFVASFLAFLFRRGRGLGQGPYSSLEAVQCRKNICVLKNRVFSTEKSGEKIKAASADWW